MTLLNKHSGQEAWIIGKGPSLQYLEASDIGAGPVITINQAIIPVEELNLPNPIYSMQKNGGDRRVPSDDNLCPDCEYSGECGDVCGNMVRPKSATLLLHEHESKFCFPDYEKRYVLDWRDFSLPGNVFSLILAVKVARKMGCDRINFVSCDAHVNGCVDTYIPGKGSVKLDINDHLYREQRRGLRPYIRDIYHRFLTPKKRPMLSFGVMVNDLQRLDMCLRQSEISGQMHFVKTPKTATSGLNKLLDIIQDEGADVAVLTHQDMYYRQGWVEQVQSQLSMLPENWVVAGVIGKDYMGRICGNFHDTRIPLHFKTGDIHTFPHPACCFDECCIFVNMESGFRFDEMPGFDLYGTSCVLQTWEMGGTAWVIDAFCEHYCTRPFTWTPDQVFIDNYKMLHDRFNRLGRVDSTAIGLPEDAVDQIAFMTSAA